MVHYKLIYFNGRGRAEGLRLLFAAAGVEYEDVRVQPDEWPALKPKTIFGKLPNIEIDGRTFCQANAIGRNLARKFNLAGKTELDQLRADMIIDCLDDILREYVAFFDEKDEARKEEMKKKYSEVELPAYYSNLEKILKSNKGGDGFFVGDDLTWPDLAFLSIVSWGKASGNESLLEKYPKLKALEKRVESVPRVAAWIAKRPVTAF